MIKKIIFYCSDYTANLTTADANGYLQDKDGVYYFRTQNNGNDTCKSPKGMFDELRIPNDLNYVIQKSNEYFN